jgi:hypothetical protein
VKPVIEDMAAALSTLARDREEGELLAIILKALDDKYALSRKMAREPGLEDIITQLVGRIFQSYGALAALQGERILDLACGSSTSRAPSFIYVDTPLGERRIPIPSRRGYTAQFEPWFCRILLELGAHPVGIDAGDLDDEAFEHYNADLGLAGALDFLPDHSFDAVHDSRLFGSPEFVAQFPHGEDRLRVAGEVRRQEQRLLSANGIVIHSDAADLLQSQEEARGCR